MSLAISAERLSWSVGGELIVRAVDLAVRPGQTVGLIGPNGCGKSSLLRCLAGLREPSAGGVFYDGADIRAWSPRRRARQVAFVEQSAETDSDLLVSEVIGLGRTVHTDGWRGLDADDRRVVDQSLARMDLCGLRSRAWSGLSGGERQRAHIARALAQRTGALLLDEPTNHLDIRHQLELLSLLRDDERTVVVALHDLSLAARFCDRLLLLCDGALVAEGTPGEVLTERRLRAVFGVEAGVHEDVNGNPAVIYRGVSGSDVTAAAR